MTEENNEWNKSIFGTHVSEESLFENLIGNDTEDGLLQWMKDEMETQLGKDWYGLIMIGTFSIPEIVRKGVFPFIQIHPASSSYENIAMCMDEHEISVQIITTIKNPRLDWGYMMTSRYASDLYDLFKSRTPSPELGSWENPPHSGKIDYDFVEGGNNQFISFSLLELNFRYDISTEAI